MGQPALSRRIRAASARSSIPTARAKQQAWASVVESDDLPNAVQAAVIRGFVRVHDTALLEPYVEPYFAALERVWSERTSEMASQIVEGLQRENILGQADILTDILLPPMHADSRSTYRRVSESGIDYPLASVAVSVIAAAGIAERTRVVLGAAALAAACSPASPAASTASSSPRAPAASAPAGTVQALPAEVSVAKALALREAGAEAVWVFATHGLFAADALERFAAADLAGIVVTDTVPVDPLRRPEGMTVLTVSGLLAQTIMNVFADESVSAIFGGENQLF